MQGAVIYTVSGWFFFLSQGGSCQNVGWESVLPPWGE